ncbi:class I SAM-dependent methyltransferase, partial [Amycolatopsis sp. NPDC058278]|uniref:class I SAM-dependent methyltransferase n=1 Tax=Amycolatopsis sp. NPDC058278 TaxID=3346417 RepID=UPI0036DD86BD
MTGAWEWDPSLYSGSARYYARGRVAYPADLATAFATELGLDGSGRLLDVGCGPGSLALPLAGSFEEAVGLDADGDMLAEAARLAADAGIGNCRWVHRRAEELPAGLGSFRVVTFAQSFHWFDRPRVAAAVRGMLVPDGVCAHVHASTHETVHPAIAELVRAYLGPVRRAGRGSLRRSPGWAPRRRRSRSGCPGRVRTAGSRTRRGPASRCTPWGCRRTTCRCRRRSPRRRPGARPRARR